MAEVFGIIAGVAGLADVGLRLTSRLREIRNNWKHAPVEIYALHNEVSELTAVLNFTRDACEHANTTNSIKGLGGALKRHIDSARLLLGYVETTMELIDSAKKGRKTMAWMKFRGEIMTKKEELKSIRLVIRDLLQAHQV